MYEGALILVFTIAYIVVLNKAYKRKTDWVSVGLLQAGIPWIIHLIAAIVWQFFHGVDDTWYPFIGISALATLLLFFLYNYTEVWFRQKYEFDKSRTVILNTLNNAPDPDTVNIYCSRFYDPNPLDKIFQQNWDIITRIRGVEPFSEMIEDYFTRNPERIVIIENQKRELGQEPSPKPKSKEKRGKRSKDLPELPKLPENEEIETNAAIEAIKQEALLVFRDIFHEFYLHVLYMRWFFFFDMDISVDLHDRLKLYVFSLKEKLPIVLNLNCTLLEDEIENGKPFTVMTAIEGYQIPAVIEKLATLANNLECLKFISNFGELERLQKRAEYWEHKCYSILDEFINLRKHDLTINSLIETKTPKRKRKIPFLGGEIDSNE